ncbi:uncharacterized protein F5Z01DRAFT_656319 [Emericellopsis atlantica]|uniref:holo-[acyl-carrier-protein] synthase n=1 Tax=Emericellopsis atlantica TaxID=2614577 RepID=A0A9P7ZLC3_9HYPO|nr:uncharacterized protein F5Z01DRAFT_656319 [Emericellopsis atlantica]KAG9254224.1 hypothetical protein F5Z01DRAFT_656319 [Emericellopsis atlantica]
MSTRSGSISSAPPRPRQIHRRVSCPVLSRSTLSSILKPPTNHLERKRRPSMSARRQEDGTLVIQWVVDTRKLWPKALRTVQLTTYAKRALDLLPKKEQVDVLKYVHVKDAKMALVSRLLKWYLISRYAPCAWDAATPTRNKNTKPVYIAPDGSEPVIFNVTHQAGLVVLIAAVRPKPGMSVGVDIVCPTERRDKDLGLISKDGWKEYVSMHEEVLSQPECTSLNRLPFKDLDHRLRYFYTLWCLREAYVKMTGEALLAPWLKRLEMRYFAPPEDAPISQTEIWFQGRLLEDVDFSDYAYQMLSQKNWQTVL